MIATRYDPDTFQTPHQPVSKMTKVTVPEVTLSARYLQDTYKKVVGIYLKAELDILLTKTGYLTVPYYCSISPSM